MSRSYKKHPYVKDNGCIKKGKKLLRKKIRQAKDVPNGNAYRKYIERWFYIHDGKEIERLNELLLGWNSKESWTEFYSSWEEVFREWITVWKGK